MEYKNVNFSKVKPLGYLRRNMQADLNGFIGNLDELVPDLVKTDDIYGNDRRTKYTPPVEVGATDVGEGFMSQYMWWNCETQGNWLDGFLRTAILLEDEKMKEKAFSYMEKYLDSADEDGYIGIYDKDLRFNHEDENGEMWAQATILRAALAYYEYKGDTKILRKVLKALDVIMSSYKIGGKSPFAALDQRNDYGCGVGHSLMIVDVFEKAYSLTLDLTYLNYCKWLYDCFSVTPHLNTDASAKTLDTDRKFSDHSVHTYEQVRGIIYAYKLDKSYDKHVKHFLEKLEPCICPSGAGIGDEYIAERQADATETGYEYCSLQELMHSYIKLYETTGNFEYIDKAQWLFYNAAMGAQFRESKITEHSSISYLKSDNSYSMCGIFQTEDENSKQLRYKYSPTHQDAAVCCVPNAGRIYTYFYEHMWYQNSNKLLKVFHGDSVLSTKIGDVEINIKEISNYPYEDVLKYIVKTSEKINLSISIRIPSYAKDVKCSENARIENGILTIEREFCDDEFTVEFVADVMVKTDLVGDNFYTYKDMLFALDIDFDEKISKKHPIDGFYDIYCSPKNDDYLNYIIGEITEAKIKGDKIEVNLFNKITNKYEEKLLKHIAKTTLRKVTFKECQK